MSRRHESATSFVVPLCGLAAEHLGAIFDSMDSMDTCLDLSRRTVSMVYSTCANPFNEAHSDGFGLPLDEAAGSVQIAVWRRSCDTDQPRAPGCNRVAPQDR